ncbi:MAG: hypothetical protein KGM47_05195 [Acidobacteriota bacterium]|nr:hypothetical protein [Acidobacteriota bacterium]
MKQFRRVQWIGLVVACIAVSLTPVTTARAFPRKHKKASSEATGPTARLYSILDQSMGGRLDLYMLADIYTDSSGQQYQRVLHVVYNKDLYFGRFTIHVRSVSKLTPGQLSTYTPEQIFNYANQDSAEFEKINGGPFGQKGDLYLFASGDHPPASSPITDDVREEYRTLLNTYIFPAVEKEVKGKQAAKAGPGIS